MYRQRIFQTFTKGGLLLFLFTAVLCLTTDNAVSQDLEETLNALSETAGKEYVRPLVDGFGANMNGGWFHKAPAANKLSFDFEFGLVAMGAFLNDDKKAFSTNGQFKFNYEQAYELAAQATTNTDYQGLIVEQIVDNYYNVAISGATAIGKEANTIKIVFPGATININHPTDGQVQMVVPQNTVDTELGGVLEDASVIPYAAPQFSIGTFYGTQATFRFIPDVEIDEEIGSVSYFGFGIQHNPLIWFPAGTIIPIDISASFFTQKLEVGDIFESTTNAFGINVSKKFGGLLGFTPYAGLMIEKSEMDFHYDYEVETSPNNWETAEINFTMEGENKNRLTVGFAFNLGILNFNADYSFAKNNVATAGFFLGF